MKDYRIKITIRNERLLHPIEKMGYKSVAEFCEDKKLNISRVYAIINGQCPPIDKNNNLKPYVIELLGILNINIDDAFTKRQLDGFKRTSFTIKANEAQLLKLANPIKNQEQKLIEGQVNNALSNILHKHLTPREERILRMLFGLGTSKTYTYTEIAELFVISIPRASQIGRGAIKKLKNHNVLKSLTEAGAREYSS